jgi:Na+(H+)/acetate symporter ActP
MLKKLLLLPLFAIILYASSFEVNQNIGTFSLPNQFDEKQTIDSSITTILVSFEKGTGKDVNQFLASKDKDFLKNHHAVFIANISGMPSIITRMFALPKMRDYKHSVLLIYDDEDKRFVSKDEKTTVYKLENGVIKSISFITKDDLEKVFQ